MWGGGTWGQFLSLSNISLLLGLEPFQKFAVVVGVGGWWWSKDILDFCFCQNLGLMTWSLDQAEQYLYKSDTFWGVYQADDTDTKFFVDWPLFYILKQEFYLPFVIVELRLVWVGIQNMNRILKLRSKQWVVCILVYIRFLSDRASSKEFSLIIIKKCCFEHFHDDASCLPILAQTVNFCGSIITSDFPFLQSSIFLTPTNIRLILL